MLLPRAAPMALWPSIMAVQAPGDRSEGHQHHTIHLVIARSGTISSRVGHETTPIESAGVSTAADVPHSIDARDREVVLLFVEPESDAGARLASAMREVRRLDARERDALLLDLPAAPGSQELAEWSERAIDRLAGGQRPARHIHPRVRRLLRLLRELPPDADTSLEALAQLVDLSPSRLMHVFTESIGIPLRPYLSWLKVQRAATAIVTGTPLSAAAIEAGFADAAHMSRTFRTMFGLTPSALRDRSQSVQAGG